MRTSYDKDTMKPANSFVKKEEERRELFDSIERSVENEYKSPDQSQVSELVKAGYVDLANAVISMNVGERIQQAAQDYSEIVMPESSVQGQETPVVKKNGMSTGTKVCVILLVIILIVAIAFCVYWFVLKDKLGAVEEPTEVSTEYVEQVPDIVSSYQYLYVDYNKTDICAGYTAEDTVKFYDMLRDAELHGEDVSNATSELDTICKYLEDREVLLKYSDSSSSLLQDGTNDVLLSLKASAEGYFTLGLKVTICDEVDKLLSERNLCVELATIFNGVEDPKSFDESSYRDKIDGVTHVPDKQLLTTWCAKLVADKEKAIAEEAVASAETEEDKKAAEEALTIATENQGRLQGELLELQKGTEWQQEAVAVDESSVSEGSSEPVENP